MLLLLLLERIKRGKCRVDVQELVPEKDLSCVCMCVYDYAV
jgi:hypothetical protein